MYIYILYIIFVILYIYIYRKHIADALTAGNSCLSLYRGFYVVKDLNHCSVSG